MKTGKKIILLIALVLLILPTVTYAVSWLPLVPCGTSANPTPCNQCDLFKLLKNIIDFVMMGLMPPAAAILFVWGGFLILMGGAVPANISKGKDIFWNTAIGVAIILASWLITNTIIRSIAADNVAPEWWKFECRVTTPGGGGVVPSNSLPPGTGTLPGGGTGLQRYSCSKDNGCISYASGPYIESSCDNACDILASNPEPGTGTLPGGGTGLKRYACSQNSCVVSASGPYIESSCDNACAVLPSTPIGGGTGTLPGGGTGLPAGGEVTCLFTGQNLCQPKQMKCSASSCSQYVGAINQYAGGVASANFLKAIMIKESSCNVSADSGHAYGLMQLIPSTANIYKSRCGVNANIDPAWLKNSQNASASICISAEYIRALSSTSCGTTPRNIAAGYNGGSGACNKSADCTGNSCDASAVKRWECLYDDTQHNVCNTGYDETRDYAVKVLYCYNNPGF